MGEKSVFKLSWSRDKTKLCSNSSSIKVNCSNPSSKKIEHSKQRQKENTDKTENEAHREIEIANLPEDGEIVASSQFQNRSALTIVKINRNDVLLSSLADHELHLSSSYPRWPLSFRLSNENCLMLRLVTVGNSGRMRSSIRTQEIEVSWKLVITPSFRDLRGENVQEFTRSFH
ncbi:hypothetical protein SESBI_38491 [Sesbania bispinosa]|nr:hypothetical protein SESBI_38491 [Sesbania bispinosa]